MSAPISAPINIVRLDGVHGPPPRFGIPHTYREYATTTPDTSTITHRLRNADVAITTRVPINATTISQLPNLKLIAVFAIGCDHIDLEACKRYKVTVCNVPAASNEAVA